MIIDSFSSLSEPKSLDSDTAVFFRAMIKKIRENMVSPIMVIDSEAFMQGIYREKILVHPIKKNAGNE